MTPSRPEPVQQALRERYAALEQERSKAFAAQAALVADMADAWDDEADLILDLAGTARAGQIRSAGALDRAVQLVRRMPTAHALLAAGRMRVATVEILLGVTRQATHAVQELVDGRLSERLAELDAVDARRLVTATLPEVEAEVDEQAQRERLDEAVRRRGVSVRPEDDAMARVTADLPALDARRWALDFEELVRAQKVLDARSGVVRTQAQRRADVFAALPSQLLALAEAAGKGTLDSLVAQDLPAVPSQRDPQDVLLDLLSLPVRKPTVLNLHVGMTTCLDLDQRSGYLEDFGPVPALLARMLLPTAGLRRIGVDERTGIPLAIDPGGGPVLTPWDHELAPGGHRWRELVEPPDLAERVRATLLRMLGPMYVVHRAEPQHDPSPALRRFTRVRDQLCDGPGCPRHVRQCELDHEQDFAAGGQTAVWNLRHRSTRCHHRKHDGWEADHDDDTGVTTWSSPSGGAYRRGSVWQPPIALPEDVDLPAPRVEPPLGRDDGHDPHELPLWPDPSTPRRPRSIAAGDVDRMRDDGTVEPPAPPRPGGGREDGPAPF